MAELILPDGLDHVVACLERIDDDVRETVDEQSLRRDVGLELRDEQQQDEGGTPDQDVIDQHLPALPLFTHHPGALEGEVADEVRGEVHEESHDRIAEGHGGLLGLLLRCLLPLRMSSP